MLPTTALDTKSMETEHAPLRMHIIHGSEGVELQKNAKQTEQITVNDSTAAAHPPRSQC